jgi:hypothetical protein
MMVNHKGQNIAEYSILIALVIAAAVAMNTFVKRGLQARIHDATKYVGDGKELNIGGGTEKLTFSGEQYEPTYVKSNSTQTSSKNLDETTSVKGQIDRTGINETSRVDVDGEEKILAPKDVVEN